MDICGGIGKDGRIPWHSREDLLHFQKVTKNTGSKRECAKSVVIMGRKTWESLPVRARPLKDRINIVVTRQNELKYTEYSRSEACASKTAIKTLNQCDFIANNIRIALDLAYKHANGGNVFIIGGANIYESAINKFRDELRSIYLTIVPVDFKCDTFVPSILNLVKNNDFREEGGDGNNAKHFIDMYSSVIDQRYDTVMTALQSPIKMFTYENRNKEEDLYLSLLQKVLLSGNLVKDRTGTGCISLFPAPYPLSFDMSTGRFPALTTKRMYLKGGICEMLFFITGKTDVKILQKMGVTYWNANTNREFLDNKGLIAYDEFDMGPTYSFLFRHQGIGHTYTGCSKEYSGGFDQLLWVIEEIKRNPTSRRLLINLWDPINMHKMTLPACAYSYQFHVNNEKGTLDCLLTQRSGDMFLGVPMNFVSAAALQCMIAHVTGYKPGVLTHMIADAHIYSNHINQVKEQLQRVSRPFPHLSFRRKITNILDFEYSDFCFDDYRPLPSIKAKMSA